VIDQLVSELRRTLAKVESSHPLQQKNVSSDQSSQEGVTLQLNTTHPSFLEHSG